MIRLWLGAAVAFASAIGIAASLGGNVRDAPTAVSSVIDQSGERVQFVAVQLIKVAAVPDGMREISSLLNVPSRLNYGDYVWNENGVPPARLWVLVDLSAQTVSVFRGKHEIGTAVLLYGTNQKPTPTGRFKVLQMSKDHWSSSYDAPMPYTLRLTADGVAIHGSLVQPR
ncbi:MAG: L,D-transpeptidase family protein, partial [Luteimonas sp.]